MGLISLELAEGMVSPLEALHENLSPFAPQRLCAKLTPCITVKSEILRLFRQRSLGLLAYPPNFIPKKIQNKQIKSEAAM